MFSISDLTDKSPYPSYQNIFLLPNGKEVSFLHLSSESFGTSLRRKRGGFSKALPPHRVRRHASQERRLEADERLAHQRLCSFKSHAIEAVVVSVDQAIIIWSFWFIRLAFWAQQARAAEWRNAEMSIHAAIKIKALRFWEKWASRTFHVNPEAGPSDEREISCTEIYHSKIKNLVVIRKRFRFRKWNDKWK